MINIFNKTWRAYKQRSRLAEIERLRSEFRIKEKNGALWITYTGGREEVAIDMIPAFASSEEVVKMLEETRCCAVEFAFGIYSEREDHKERKERKERDREREREEGMEDFETWLNKES